MSGAQPGPVVKSAGRSRMVTISRDNYLWFKPMATARALSPGNVSSLVALLQSGGHFETSLAINDLSSGGKHRYVLIDGFHRITAIGQVIEADPSFKIEVEFKIYDHRDDMEARSLFDKWNDGKPQTQMSRLWVNRKDYPIVPLLMNDFPVPVSFESTSRKGPFLRASPLLVGIASWGRSHLAFGGRPFYESVAGLTKEDHTLAKKWAEDFKAALGDPGRANPFSTTAPLIALLRVWRANIVPLVNGQQGEPVGREELIRRLRAKVAENVTVRQQVLSARGTAASPLIESYVVDAMNRGEGHLRVVRPCDVWKARPKGTDRTRVVLSAPEWERFYPLFVSAYETVSQRDGAAAMRSSRAVVRQFETQFPGEFKDLSSRASRGAMESRVSRWRRNKWAKQR